MKGRGTVERGKLRADVGSAQDPAAPAGRASPLSDAVHELTLLVRSRHPLVVVETPEEERVRGLLGLAADRLDLPLLVWSPARGLTRSGASGGVYGTEPAQAALAHVAASPVPAVYHFPDLAPLLRGDAVVGAQLREALRSLRTVGGTLFVTGAALELGPGLAALATEFPLPTPTEHELRDLLTRLVEDVGGRQRLDVAMTPSEVDRLLRQLQGLTLIEAEKILTKAMVEDGRLTADDISHVIDAKKDVIEREGLLEYYPVDDRMPEIADLVRLRAWLAKRRAFVTRPQEASEFGLSFPKGVLLLGVPGCGKSLSAKAVAAEWRLPLLKLDPSNLYNKYVGQSEANFKRAMRAAERMAPVVLWIDELEKAFAVGGGDDGGVSTRILGSFLSWMQERTGDVFVVATANQIAKLPPELLRKGRFDEIFFLDLPDAPTRAEIFRIHLAARSQDPDAYDLTALAEATEGFSGAEIEQVVVAALFSAFSGAGSLTQDDLVGEVTDTVPLARTMAERVAGMRAWARERAVPAN